jgi:O-antigen/teichoic acid export membrane protein
MPDSAEHAEVTRALARGGAALLANSALTAILGVVFWLVAARLLTTSTVGRGSALGAALLTISGFSQLNYARSLSGLMPRDTRPRRLLARVYGLTCACSLVVGLVSALILPEAGASFRYLRGDILFIAVFSGSVVLWTIFNLEDTALTSMRQATIVPFENGAYGVLKVICLFALWRIGQRTSVALFISWVLPLVAVILPVNLFLFLRAVPAQAPSPTALEKRSPPWVRYDFAGYLLWLAGTLPLPVLVAIMVGATKAASFYVPFTIVTAIDLLSLNLGNSLTAELSRSDGIITPAARSHLRRVWVTVGLIAALLCIVSPYVLLAFGDTYRAGGTLILRIFMIAALPRSVLFIGIAVLRSRSDGRAILLLQAISSVGTLGLGLALSRPLGGVGTALGWLTASCVAALAALPAVYSGRRGARRISRAKAVASANRKGHNIGELRTSVAASAEPRAQHQIPTPPDRPHGNL